MASKSQKLSPLKWLKKWAKFLQNKVKVAYFRKKKKKNTHIQNPPDLHFLWRLNFPTPSVIDLRCISLLNTPLADTFFLRKNFCFELNPSPLVKS